MKRKAHKIMKKSPKVDMKLLRESLKISRELARCGMGPGRSYSLRSPYESRLVRTTPGELADLECD